MTRWRASDRVLPLSLTVGTLLAPVAAEAQARRRDGRRDPAQAGARLISGPAASRP